MHALQVIQQLAASSGHSKLKVLHENPQIKNLLYYCYNPFYRFHITPPKQAVGLGVGSFDGESLALLDNLVSRQLSGNAAKEVVAAHIHRLSPPDAELFKLVLSKDMRAGISGKTINKVWPGTIPLHEVQLAKTYCLVNKTGREVMKSAKVNGSTWTSPKVDGLRGKLNHLKLFTRNGHQILGCSHIPRLLGHGFDGEVVIPGVDFYRSSGFIRDHKDHPTAEYHIFDAPSYDAPFKERLAYARACVEDIGDPRLKVVPHEVIHTHEQAIAKYHEHRAAGYEGSMIKTMDYKYVGSRSRHWLKIKNFDTYDLKVVGHYQGKGRLCHTLGGLIVDFNGVEVNVGGGFSDMERSAIWENLDDIEGKVIEVHAHEETPDGSLREPRFKGWRFDKDI